MILYIYLSVCGNVKYVVIIIIYNNYILLLHYIIYYYFIIFINNMKLHTHTYIYKVTNCK